MRTALLIVLILAALDALFVTLAAIICSMKWISVVDNFGSDVGKATVSDWHFDHVRSVEAIFGQFMMQGIILVVLLIAALALVLKKTIKRKSQPSVTAK